MRLEVRALTDLGREARGVLGGASAASVATVSIATRWRATTVARQARTLPRRGHPSPTTRDGLKRKRAPRCLEPPTLERRDRLFERRALVRVVGRRQQFFVGLDCKIDSLIIVLGTGETRGVVGEICLGEMIRWKPCCYLLPSCNTFARI